MSDKPTNSELAEALERAATELRYAAKSADCEGLWTVAGACEQAADDYEPAAARLREMEQEDAEDVRAVTAAKAACHRLGYQWQEPDAGWVSTLVRGAERAERELSEAHTEISRLTAASERWESPTLDEFRREAKVREQAERIKELVQRIEGLETAVGNIEQTTMHYEFYGPTTALLEIASQARAALAAADQPATEEPK